MMWYQLKLKLNSAYQVSTKHGVQHNDRDNIRALLIKRIKADFIKEVILSIEVKMLVMEPYYFEE